MRLGISNIAWDVGEDAAMARLLQSYAVDAIDVAPTKYFPDPEATADRDVDRVRRWWRGQGVEITGMQSLLFGTQGLNLFAGPEVQQAMLLHLDAVCRIGAGLGARRLVFGSPRNRDRAGLDDPRATEIAVGFFRRLGAIARARGVTICLEPCPRRYGANFMTTTLETAAVVERVAHPNIRMQLDTGCLAITGEDPAATLQACSGAIGHIHASEPDLVPLGSAGTDHEPIAEAIRRHLKRPLVTIEMVATTDQPHPRSVASALAFAVRHYRNPDPSSDA
jgi:sugar phosphate isomerase/epimerase